MRKHSWGHFLGPRCIRPFRVYGVYTVSVAYWTRSLSARDRLQHLTSAIDHPHLGCDEAVLDDETRRLLDDSHLLIATQRLALLDVIGQGMTQHRHRFVRGSGPSVGWVQSGRVQSFGPGRRVPKSYFSCSCWNHFSRIPKAFLIRSATKLCVHILAHIPYMIYRLGFSTYFLINE